MKLVTIFITGSQLSFPFQEGVEENLVAWIEEAMDNPDGRYTWVGSGPDGPSKVVLKGNRICGYFIRVCPPPQETPIDVLKEFMESQKQDDGEEWKDDER